MTNQIDLLPFTTIKDCALLMMAPPGWGKTTLILDLYDRITGKIVFISPLRALAEEFYTRAKERKNIYMAKGAEEIKSFLSVEKSMLIATAEKLNESLIELGETEDILFIFDEFHLFYYWGDTFRPILQERLMCAANSKSKILAMTATMDEQLLKRWKRDFKNSMSHCYTLNLGNQVLLNKPEKIYNFRYLNERVFNRAFIKEAMNDELSGTILIFVRLRVDVEKWMTFCDSLRIENIGCVGGEIPAFLDSLKQCPRPRCIISTSALSHGVNLPTISKVFLSYPIENIDFWIQMVGRGGRDGSSYDVYEVEKWNWLGDRKKLFWNILYSMLFLLRDFFQTLYRGRL